MLTKAYGKSAMSKTRAYEWYNVKVMLFDFNGIVHHECLPRGQMAIRNITYKFKTVCIKQSEKTSGFVEKHFMAFASR